MQQTNTMIKNISNANFQMYLNHCLYETSKKLKPAINNTLVGNINIPTAYTD